MNMEAASSSETSVSAYHMQPHRIACSHEWNTLYYMPTPLSPYSNFSVFIPDEEINIYGRNRRKPYKYMQRLQKQNPKRINP